MISASSCLPCSPVSLKPAEMTIAAGNAELDAFAEQGGNSFGRSADDHQVGNLRQRLQRGIGANAEDMGALGIDRIDDAAERAADQVPEHGAAHRTGALAGTHQGDAGGFENGVQWDDDPLWNSSGAGLPVAAETSLLELMRTPLSYFVPDKNPTPERRSAAWKSVSGKPGNEIPGLRERRSRTRAETGVQEGG